MNFFQKGSLKVWIAVVVVVLVLVIGYCVSRKPAQVDTQQPVVSGSQNQVPDSDTKSDAPMAPAPSVKILAPNGGEILRIASTYPVSFAMTKGLGMKTIRLNRYSAEGVQVDSVTVGMTEADTFSWTVPGGLNPTNGNNDRYKLQVIVNKYNSGKGVSDESDGYFSIFPRLSN